MAALEVLQSGKSQPSKEVSWYDSDIQNKIKPEMLELLLKYSKIPAEDLVAHISKVVG